MLVLYFVLSPFVSGGWCFYSSNQPPKPDPNKPAHAAYLRYRQGTIPSFMLDATSLYPPEIVAKMLGDRNLD